MKHIFIVETPDDTPIDREACRTLATKLEGLVEVEVGKVSFCLSRSNFKSAARGVYQMYGLDQSQSPDQLGCSQNAEDSE